MNDENLTFLSASEFGSYLKPGSDAYRRFGLDKSSPMLDGSTRNGFVPTDFAGINSNIYDPLSSSTNTLGYPNASTVMSYVNWGSPYTAAIDYTANPLGGFIQTNYETVGVPLGASIATPAPILNSLILHRQGPYGWPTWKQIRTGNHPIARHFRKNNIFSVVEKSFFGKSTYGKDQNVYSFKT